LAEFLNPKGTHGQGDLFLRLFVDQFVVDQPKLKDFNTKSAIAGAEKDVGPINEDNTTGGIIDILITDNKKSIAIENKIYAQDQENQLLRYHNSVENPILFYLTLDGSAPSDRSRGNLDKWKYKTISYHADIIDWLENCRKEAVSLPIIRETITQYINHIKFLTHQTSKVKMKEEIRNLILDNTKYTDSIELCSEILNEITRETKGRFLKKLKEKLIVNIPNETIIDFNNDVTLIVHSGEDAGGIYIGYRAIKNNLNDSKDSFEYKDLLRNIYPNMKSSIRSIGWYTPAPFKFNEKIEQYDKNNGLKLSKDTLVFEEIIDKIVQEENEIRSEFIRKIKPAHK
jgi:hypothetical protein